MIELTLSALLNVLGAEHRAGIHELCGQTAWRNQIMLRNGTHHRSRSFWTQAETAIALHMTAAKQGLEVFARDRGEHLFRNHIGCLADAAHEKFGLLEDGRLDRLVTITREHRRSA